MGQKISLSISNKEKIKQTSLSQFYNLCFRAQAQNSVHVPQDDIPLTEPKTVKQYGTRLPDWWLDRHHLEGNVLSLLLFWIQIQVTP